MLVLERIDGEGREAGCCAVENGVLRVIGIVEVTLREIQSGSNKSPQFRNILVKGEDQYRSRSQKIANYRSLFLRSRIIRVFRRN